MNGTAYQQSDLMRRLKWVQDYGDLNGMTAKRADNLHRLFLYPAMMVPVTQSLIIEAISGDLPINAMAIDPYMGSATSLMSCMEYGLGIYGQDINPLAVLIAQAKISSFDIELITNTLEELMSRIKADSSDSINVNFPGIDKWFTKQVQIDLSKIRRNIQNVNNKDIRKLFWVIMSEVIRIDSNDRTSTFKLHRRAEEDISKRTVNVISDFETLCKRGILDITLFRNKLDNSKLLQNNIYIKPNTICWGNTAEKIHSDLKFDLLVSSPPYGDNHTTVTYGQHSYLQLQWIDSSDLDFSIDYDYLRSTQEIDRQSLGGRIDSKGLTKKLSEILNNIPSLKEFYDNLPYQERPLYNKTISFIQDFEKSLDVIVRSMKEKAFYVWTIGNRNVNKREIPNDKILIDLMRNKGVDLIFNVEREILNKKQSKRNRSSKTMEKERILIFQRQY
ncbi:MULTISPECIES: hypothetical protein [Alistipes]|uniref:hypothetical protein n=1 Tax=Alistipes TaxID=239759 RepID=UPI001B39E702|nr:MULTISPECIES: hypothetical protein [Alistipes]MBQ4904409.1 hypothetical protein [Alistipes sp. Marseille-P2263]MCI2259691.1 hypothetical protein [Alistipes dispar]